MSRVALIATVYNEAGSIQHLLRSIDRQTRLPDETVIVDAGSSDGTLKILQRWRDCTPLSVQVISSPGANIAKGRNIAIEATDAELIAGTDAGCILEENWLEQLVNSMEEGHYDLVFGGTRATGDTSVGRAFAAFYNGKTHSRSYTLTEHSSRSVAFRRAAWESVGGYPEELTLAGEDTLFFQRLDKFGSCAVNRNATVIWKHGAEKLSSIYGVHRRNAIGEGEVLAFRGRFLALAGGYLTALALAVWPSKLTRVTSAVLLLGFGSRLSRKAMARKPVGRLGLMLLVVISAVRDVAMLDGYCRGMAARFAAAKPAPEAVGKHERVAPK